MTFSIVARCPRTAMLGVAVSTAVPAVGAMCPYVRSGVGAVSTQAWVNPYLALDTLDNMANGMPAAEALQTALARDGGKALRQIGVVDAAGRSSAWSGGACTPWSGQITDQSFAVQGNMLIGAATLDAMALVFQNNEACTLAERLLLALEAGDRAGGDQRGTQSAAIRVHGTEHYAWLDLRVDEHATPVAELRRVYEIARQQLLPFVEGMPKKGAPAGALPENVSEMLLLPPPQRPGGGGAGPRR